MRILFQGDSITDGNRGRTEDPNHILGHGYVFNIASYLGAEYPQKFEFFNRGIGGDTSTRLLARWHTDAVALKPDLTTILIGTNDTHHGIAPKRYESVLHMLIDDLPDSKIILMEPFRYRNQQTDEAWATQSALLAEYRKIVRKIAEERNAVFIPLAEVWEEAFQKAPQNYWIWDGIHPTYSGHQILSRAWLKGAHPLLFPEKYT